MTLTWIPHYSLRAHARALPLDSGEQVLGAPLYTGPARRGRFVSVGSVSTGTRRRWVAVIWERSAVGVQLITLWHATHLPRSCRERLRAA